MDSCLVVHCLTAWTSREGLGKRDGEMFSDRRDRVFDVTFGPDRRSCGVENLWVTEASCAARRLRGESPPVRRSESRKLRCRVSRGGESHANLDLRNELIRVQRNLALSTRSCKGVSLGKVDSQYFVGAASPFGHSTMSHSTGCGLVRL